MKTKVLRIAAVQMKFRPSLPANVEVICAFIVEAARRQVDAVLFPECALTGYSVDFREFTPREIGAGLKAVAAAARASRCQVLVGSPTFAQRRWHNSLVVFDRYGREQFRYHKIHLTPRDAEFFTPGNSVGFFRVGGVPSTAIICHERRYPELVRLPVMLGAQIVFHPNAGLDPLPVSQAKRAGRDGIAGRAFENQVFYVFANSVGRQGRGLWSAGDSKLVDPDSQVLALADNQSETLIHSEIHVSLARRKYARAALQHPAYLRPYWKAMLAACRRQLARRSSPRT